MFVCWGELLWDVFDAGNGGARETLGGCACNVAYHLAQLGADVALVSRVGADERGQRAMAELQAIGVQTNCIEHDATAPTASVAVELDHTGPRYRMLARMDWSRIRITDVIARTLSNCQCFVFGTLAQRSPLALTTLSQALALVPDDCIRIVDLNLRPGESSRDLIESCTAHAHAIKLNEQEAEKLGKLLGTADPVAWLLNRPHARWVFQTLGERGCLVATHTSRHHYDAVELQPAADADPVGAGDAFCARMALGLVNHDALHEVASACNAHAARVAARPGATPRL
jgi:fructokinase